jgi:hypothetical protein
MKVYCETCDKDVEPEFDDSIVDQSTDPDCVILDLAGFCPICYTELIARLLKLDLEGDKIIPIETP